MLRNVVLTGLFIISGLASSVDVAARADELATGMPVELARFQMNGVGCPMRSFLYLCNGQLTFKPNPQVIGFSQLFAPPLSASQFDLKLKIAEKEVPLTGLTWFPSEMHSEASQGPVKIRSILSPIPGRRAVLGVFEFHNTGEATESLPISIHAVGGVGNSPKWAFMPPICEAKTTAETEPGKSVLTLVCPDGMLRIAADWPNATIEGQSLRTQVQIGPDQRFRFALVVQVATDRETAAAETATILGDPQKHLSDARTHWVGLIQGLYTRFPRVETDNAALQDFYDRGLLTLLTCRWESPGFFLQPWYSTGGIDGGALCAYLWDFAYASKILILYDPDAVRRLIGRFLTVDMTNHYALNPLDGEPLGPWYAYNSYGIAAGLYHYVALTGDTDFLNQSLDGRTVLERAMDLCLLRDDLAKPPALIDYGTNYNLLELRRTNRYQHYVPSPNGERYWSYRALAQLSRLAGTPRPEFDARAENLKETLLQSLWDPQAKWLACVDQEQKHHLAWSIQIFDLLRTGLLNREQQAGIIGHLNDREFLSDYGVHSLAKTDDGYDPADVDWGGPGVYAGDAPNLAEDLYAAGWPDQGGDVLRRILWWGQRLPYYPQAIHADKPEIRQDGRANIIGSTGSAQAIIFGVAGIRVDPEQRRIEINPHLPPETNRLDLSGVRIQGQEFDIHVEGNYFQVQSAKETVSSTVGTPVSIDIP